MIRKLFLLSILLCSIVGVTLGQTITVKGKVLDEHNEPIIGATIRSKSDPKKGAQSNLQGMFSLQAKKGEIITISFLGYTTQEIEVAPNMTVSLKPDTELLDEVVVVAYGTAKKQSLVGAQSNVSAKQLENRPVTNISNALAAAAPGVQVTTTSGQPGASASILIRGFGSVNASSAPLYVVDGAIYGGSISDIATSDIASVSILKDASSTALYGSSAGNGVILITTKSGARGKSGKPTLNFTVNIGGNRRGQDRYDTVDAYDYVRTLWRQFYNTQRWELKKDAMQAALQANIKTMNDMRYQPFAGIKTDIGADAQTYKLISDPKNPEKQNLVHDLTLGNKGSFNSVKVPLLGEGTHNLYRGPYLVTPDGTLNPEITGLLWGDDTNWEDELFRTGVRKEYVLNSGYNNDRVTSFLSLSYLGDQGYKKYTSFFRLSSRVNLQYKITNWLKIGTNTSFNQTSSESPKKEDASFSSSPFGFLSNIAPIFPIHRHHDDGSYDLDRDGNKQYDYDPNRTFLGGYNPVYEQQIDKSYAKRDALTSRSFIELKPYDGITFRVNYAYDLISVTSKTRFNNIMGDQPQGVLDISKSRSLTVTFNQLLEYNKTFGKHDVSVLLGHESYDYLSESGISSKEKMFVLGVDEMSNLSKMSEISSSSVSSRTEGYLFRSNYSYNNRYNFSVSYRRDGSSIFAPDMRWGNFWSIGAGWNITNEEFMKRTDSWLNYLKLRFSVGQTGNDNISSYYAYQTLYGIYNNYETPGLVIDAVGNPLLRWEKQTASDLAVEFSIFNRLSGTIELFNKESDDLLFSTPKTISTGISSIDENIGKVRNYGVEMDFKVNLFRSRDFYWDITMNGTIFKNKIVSLPDINKKNGIETAYNKYVEGGSMKDFYLRKVVGIDEENGRTIYVIDAEKYPEKADPESEDGSFVGLDTIGEKSTWTYSSDEAKKEFSGSSIPALYGGFGTNLSWKGIDVNVLFSYQLGGKIYDSGYASLLERNMKGGRTFHKDILNAWKEPGDKSQIPALYDGEWGRNSYASSERFLVTASALMLKNVSLGYNLPVKWIENLQLSNVRVGVAGENLFLLSARKGLNPMGTYSGIVSNGLFGYAKTVTGTVSVTF